MISEREPQVASLLNVCQVGEVWVELYVNWERGVESVFCIELSSVVNRGVRKSYPISNVAILIVDFDKPRPTISFGNCIQLSPQQCVLQKDFILCELRSAESAKQARLERREIYGLA